MSAVSNSVSIVCVSSCEKIVNQQTLVVPASATIADLKKAMGKTVQVLVAGAVPSETTLIADLAAAYGGANGELRVSYSTEGRFGGVCVGTPIGCGAGW